MDADNRKTTNPLTGEPDAGDPPVRFGGRGSGHPLSLPLSPLLQCRGAVFGELAEVEEEEAMEKFLEFADLCTRGLKLWQICPIGFHQCGHQRLCGGREFGRARVGFLAELTEQFEFEREDSAWFWGLLR